MNRLASMALALLMLCSVAAAPPWPTIRPYTAFAWTPPAEPLRHVIGMVRYQSSSDPVTVAAALKRLPTGERFLLRWESNDNHFWKNPGDQLAAAPASAKGPATRPAATQPLQGPWASHGGSAEMAFETRFAAALHEQGATPDFLVLDTEMGINTFDLTQLQLDAIVADSRWPALARRFGVGDTSGLPTVTDTPAARRFNLAMQVTTGEFVRAAYFVPWTRVFPTIHCSDFGDGVLSDAQANQAIDDNGIAQPMALPMRGDTQSPYCYGWVHGLAHSPTNQHADFAKPLPTLCWLVSMVRAYAQSPQPILPWIAAPSWTDGHVTLLGTPYPDELLWHLCLSAGCTDVLLFNPDSSAADETAIDHDLASLQQETGDSPTLVPLTNAAVPFGSSVLVSGARCADGRRLYRITAEPSPTSRSLHLQLPEESKSTTIVILPGQAGTWAVR